jgi:hypothetical protein
MSVCHSTSLVLEEGALCYYGPQDAHWRVPLDAIRVLGEFRSSELEHGHYLAVVIDDSGAWLQCPCIAVGVPETLRELAHIWDAPLELRLGTASSDASRVLWPKRLAGEEMFTDASGRLELRSVFS